ncbi:MAG: PDZ domain-containing protein [Elusimicrobia bacterium]|nr:PDZ domain-containing protein [Elusimicrobiota bacterium]
MRRALPLPSQLAVAALSAALCLAPARSEAGETNSRLGAALEQLRALLGGTPAPAAPPVPKAAETRRQAPSSYGEASTGIAILLDELGPKVWHVAPGSPAAGEDIKAGDRLTEIDGRPAASLDRATVVSRLRGAPGTVVKLTLERGEPDEDGTTTVSVAVTRLLLPRPNGPTPSEMTPPDAIAEMLASNRQLQALVFGLALSEASPGLQQALRLQAKNLAAPFPFAYYGGKTKRGRTGAQAEAEAGHRLATTSLAQAQAILDGLERLDWGEVEAIQRRAPLSGTWLASLAVQVQAANLRRAVSEFGKLTALQMAQQATRGARDDHHWTPWPYQKLLEGEAPRNARLTRAIEEALTVQAAAPAYRDAADLLAAASAFRHPPTR